MLFIKKRINETPEMHSLIKQKAWAINCTHARTHTHINENQVT